MAGETCNGARVSVEARVGTAGAVGSETGSATPNDDTVGSKGGGGGEGGVERAPRESSSSCERNGGGIGLERGAAAGNSARTNINAHGCIDGLAGRGSEGARMSTRASDAASDELAAGSVGAELRGQC